MLSQEELKAIETVNERNKKVECLARSCSHCNEVDTSAGDCEFKDISLLIDHIKEQNDKFEKYIKGTCPHCDPIESCPTFCDDQGCLLDWWYGRENA